MLTIPLYIPEAVRRWLRPRVVGTGGIAVHDAGDTISIDGSGIKRSGGGGGSVVSSPGEFRLCRLRVPTVSPGTDGTATSAPTYWYWMYPPTGDMNASTEFGGETQNWEHGAPLCRPTANGSYTRATDGSWGMYIEVAVTGGGTMRQLVLAFGERLNTQACE